ncbi:short-chain dehydrogenase [Brevirhabdus pacifica]|uniref:Short-chain dehydrogenase n=1 Tax=Brevirhabdus pacifica TaxID=1267768 RepID=A0A1U7DLK6_9RHOB|nr:SDR family oxidoreductase [Brevirhabdus pacifica]APX90773.1 short-chain dehydrogenase [Brevirhabdus pacifica]OWU79559.1 short-chain dehydrogenase [Loktanella sp. 22II-4b]PJJ87348.1 NAD(P)-dependent dehydrogenase (short-subunit alcohol dehydrogenase family) [Brevirhabdus pacifica]
MTLFDLGGKTALVTGSTKGIGRAVATQLVRAGANVIVSSRTAEDCASVAQEISAIGPGRAVGIAANISHDEAIDRLVAEGRAQLGEIDILVCNAAVNPYFGPFLETPDDAFDKTIRVNIRSNMRLARLVVPHMQAQRDGAIVVISSIAAFKGSDNLGMYALTKAADTQLVRNLAVAYGADNIRANGIAPALVKTDFARALWEDPARAARVADSYALKRLGEPDDIAGAAVFLASPAGRWMTGQTLIIDGGWSVLD